MEKLITHCGNHSRRKELERSEVRCYTSRCDENFVTERRILHVPIGDSFTALPITALWE
ncbi:MAG: hypothetical protein ACXWM7_04060 [Parachlamydiaceae bacterium]